MEGCHTIRTAIELGELIRLRRRELGLTLQRASSLAGVGSRFLSELERGKPTVELEKTLTVLQLLGLEIQIGPREGRKT